ncbi:hypothetical protein ACH492_30145 [Streptomyces sp. NPDC019443]|uniref:hypothetical protein n=1 Tax=Streptomyces sp. NPDC019443 TaxID=3365061 RepID=UPI0037946916
MTTTKTIRVGGRTVELSRPDKMLFPEDGMKRKRGARCRRQCETWTLRMPAEWRCAACSAAARSRARCSLSTSYSTK